MIDDSDITFDLLKKYWQVETDFVGDGTLWDIATGNIRADGGLVGNNFSCF